MHNAKWMAKCKADHLRIIASASSQFDIHVSNIGCVRLKMGIKHGIHILPEKVIISHP